ncbi:MAG: hypothetical protein JSU03_07680 [Bacteroidetes bacterium]|nr:hypothetical protein [Bacteroidota bacterium]MBS1757140.1 hypothetical protein [Bacteroidota bacterium]
MSCCGKKREELSQNLSSQKVAGSYIPAKSWEDVLFEYTGPTGLTVKGIVSRNIYRFNSTGDTQLVDYRDASGMLALPMLKRVSMLT